MRSARRWTCAVAALVAVLAGLGCTEEKPPLEFTITYQNAKGLETGQHVVYNGVPIGTVQEVKLTEAGTVAARVLIQEEHEPRVYREAEYIIKKRGGITDLTGERQIVMNDRNVKEKTPVQPGDIIKGTEGWTDQLTHRVSGWGGAAYDWAAGLGEKVKAWASSPEGKEFQDSVREFGAKAKDMTAEQWEHFKTEEYPKLREKAVELKEKLERDGKSEEAKELWDSFTRFGKRLFSKEPQGEEPDR